MLPEQQALQKVLREPVLSMGHVHLSTRQPLSMYCTLLQALRHTWNIYETAHFSSWPVVMQARMHYEGKREGCTCCHVGSGL